MQDITQNVAQKPRNHQPKVWLDLVRSKVDGLWRAFALVDIDEDYNIVKKPGKAFTGKVWVTVAVERKRVDALKGGLAALRA